MSNIRTYTISAILAFIGIVLVCAAAWAFWQVRTVMIYILVAAVITMITRPLEKRLERIRIRKKKIPRGFRALIILLSIYAILFTLVYSFVPLVLEEAKNIADSNNTQLSSFFHEPMGKIQDALPAQPAGDGEQSFLDYLQNGAMKLLNATQVSSFVRGLISLFGSVLVAFFAISFFTFFFLKDGPAIFEMVLLLVPVKHAKSVRNIIGESQVMLGKYFAGVLIDVLFVSSFVSIGLMIIGVKYALVIGAFAGIMNIIPYVGPLISGAFAIIVGVSSNLSLDFYSGILPLTEKIIAVFVLMNLIDAFLVQPFIFSNRVKAHPIEIFAVILIAGSISGVAGMIVAVPVYTICRIIAREFFSKYRFVQRLTDELDEVSDPHDKHNS